MTTTAPATTTSTKTAKKAPQKALPTKAITAFVVAGAKGKAPAPGLFVLFRAARPPEDDPFAKIVAATETEPPPEDPAAEGGDAAAAPAATPAPRPFALGRCDADGVLGSADPDDGAARADAYKLVGAYEMYFVHHPSLDVARAWLERVAQPDAPAPHAIEISSAEVVLPTEAAAYLPPGPARYGGWTLFRKMPLQALPAIQDQVKALQTDLGLMRWLVGNEDGPYLPLAKGDTKYEDAIREPSVGEFSAQVMSGVLGFQEVAMAGQMVRLVAAAPATSWDWVDVETDPVPLANLPAVRDGVVDTTTADAIAEAVSGRLRRAGQILVVVTCTKAGGKSWLRHDAALAYRAWTEVTKALGGVDGVSFGHSYRSIYNSVRSANPGKAVRSPHKTGCALDLQMIPGGVYKPGADQFPVVMVHELDPRDSFRLFLPSIEPIPPAGQRAASVTRLSAALDALAERAATDPQLSLVPAVCARIQEVMADPDAFYDRYYRPSVEPWTWEATNCAGGCSAPPAPPKKGQSWLDITRVGAASGLGGIHPQGGWQYQAVKVLPASDLPKVVAELRAARGQRSQEIMAGNLAPSKPQEPMSLFGPRPEWEESPVDRTVLVERAAGSLGEGTPLHVPLIDVDIDLIERWGKSLHTVASKGLKRVRASHAPELEIALSARKPPPELDHARAALAGFEAVPFVGSSQGKTETKTGADWLKTLEARHAELIAPATLTDKSKGTAPPRLTEYVVRLAPVISKGTSGSSGVVLGLGDRVSVPRITEGIARCQEWWHYQLPIATGANWLANMRELGWRQEHILEEPMPEAHGRTGVGYARMKNDP